MKSLFKELHAVPDKERKMPQKKFYAVKKGVQTGLFDTWEECRRMVYGFPGAVYKSFDTKQEAEEYLNGISKMQVQDLQMEPGSTLTAYVDGSFDQKNRRYSFGCVFLTPDGEVIRESGSGNDPKSLQLRNVTGEMLGAMFAVRWALKNGYPAVDICYDYAGIEQWATKGWQAKNDLTRQYAAFMERCSRKIRIRFTKIAAHTGDKYNEEADQLAKQALTDKDGIPQI